MREPKIDRIKTNNDDHADYDAWQSLAAEQTPDGPRTIESAESPLSEQLFQALGKASLDKATYQKSELGEASLKQTEPEEMKPADSLFPASPSAEKARALDIEEQVEAINDSIEDRSDHETLKRTALNLLQNGIFEPEAVVAAFGPSLFLQIERFDAPVENLNIGEFVNRLAQVPTRDAVKWQTACKRDVLRNLWDYSELGSAIDLRSLVKNSSDDDVLDHIMEITDVLPDFDVNEFLAQTNERDPRALAEHAIDILMLGYYYPPRQIAERLEEVATEEIKFAPDREWSEMLLDEYEGYLFGLSETYEMYDKLTPDEKTYIKGVSNRLNRLLADPTRVYHGDVKLETISQAAMDSLEAKVSEFREKMHRPRWQLKNLSRCLDNAGDKFDRAELERTRLDLLVKTQRLASDTIASFTPEELSYFRRLYISYDATYDGTEDIGTIMTFDNPWYDLCCLHTADADFKESAEFYDYLNRQYDQRRVEEWAKLKVTYPQIFDQLDRAEMREVTDEVLNHVPPEPLAEIADLKRQGLYREADQALVKLLSEVLKLKEVPKIKYPQEYEGYLGDYNYYYNTVSIYRAAEGDAQFEETDVIDTIAHELWHAHQHDEAARQTERGKLYEENFDEYQDATGGSDTDYEIYATQLVEEEARLFGEEFARLYRNWTSDSATTIRIISEDDPELDNWAD